MLDVRWVSDHLDDVLEAMRRRSSADADALTPIRELSSSRRELIGKVESLQADRNRASEAMARLAKGGDKAEFTARREEMKQVAGSIKALEAQLADVEEQIRKILLNVPNVPHESVPAGQREEENPVVRVHGEKPQFDFGPKAHDELGVKLGILDFERAAKLSGARFTVLWGAGARLERALIHFMLNLHTSEHGYLEVDPPFLVRGDTLLGTGQLPKFEQDLFKTQRRDADDADALYLIPTAEVPVTNLHANEILEGARLPLAYCAYTPCFRSEAGSYGRDVRGYIRQHQFDKVELVRFCDAESGVDQLELLTSHAERVLDLLGLHYRTVEHCAGDLGFGAAKSFDLEVWLPAQKAYREISSCSWYGDFQARRAKIRYRSEPKSKPKLGHTLNGSALAVGRTVVAILEQFQQPDGSVVVPEPLRPLMNLERITGP